MFLQNVKDGDYQMIKCKECGHTEFIMAVQLKLVPKTISPSGRTGVLVSRVYVCKNCGTVIDLQEMIDAYDEEV